MKKIIILIIMICIFGITTCNMNRVDAYSTGSGYYGTNMSNYEIIGTNSKFTDGSTLVFGGTDKYEYYTYYLYAKLRVNTIAFTDDSFQRVYDGTIAGAYTESLTIGESLTMKTTIGYSVVEDASINLAFTSHHSWAYTYSEGEEIEFNVSDSNTEYYSVAVVALEIIIVERYVLEEVKYAAITGKEKERTLHEPVYEEWNFTCDYDLIPVAYSSLKSADKNNYILKNGEYVLRLPASDLGNLNTYVPDVNSNYIAFLEDEIKNLYYAK